MPLVDVVMPICGMGSCLRGYLRSVYIRACGGLRVVLVSSNSSSNSKRLYSLFTRESKQVGIVRRAGTNRDTTEGENLTMTRNRFLNFISDSS